MSAREVAIMGPNNIKAKVTGQEELLVKINEKKIIPVILSEIGANTLGVECTSISFANVGTVDVVLSFDAGNTTIRLKPGTTVNMDAGSNNNYYPKSIFSWEADAFGAGELLVTYNERP